VSGIVLVAAAAAYAAALGVGGVTFNATPLLVGLAAIVAGAAGRTTRLMSVGLALAGWGVAVLAVRNGPLPDNRSAPAFLVGVALGLLAADRFALRRHERITGAIIASVVAGLAFYAAYDVAALGRWPAWAIALALWGGWELVRSPAGERAAAR